MKNKLLIIGLLFFTVITYATRETLTFSRDTDITLRAADVLSQQTTVDVRTMTVNFETEVISIYLVGQDTPLRLYPDPSERTPAVDAAFTAMRNQANIIMLHAVENGHYK